MAKPGLEFCIVGYTANSISRIVSIPKISQCIQNYINPGPVSCIKAGFLKIKTICGITVLVFKVFVST
jgi:hypothetical protein